MSQKLLFRINLTTNPFLCECPRRQVYRRGKHLMPHDMEEENPTYATTDSGMNSKSVLHQRRYAPSTHRLLNHRLSRAVDSLIAKRAWKLERYLHTCLPRVLQISKWRKIDHWPRSRSLSFENSKLSSKAVEIMIEATTCVYKHTPRWVRFLRHALWAHSEKNRVNVN